MLEKNNNLFDTAIVGAGPAGSSAAYAMASKGYKVLLIEKASLPRYKTCGGGVVNKSMNLLPPEIQNIVERYCSVIELFDHQANLKFYKSRSYPVISMVMRKDFDFAILSLAKQQGLIVKDNCTLIELKNNNEHVELLTDKGEYKTKFVIAADGASGIISKKIGMNNNCYRIPALEYEVYVDENVFNKFANKARFDFGVIQDGYGWVFPKKEHLSVGIGTLKKDKRNLNEMIEKYFNLLGLNDIKRIERHGYFIPLNRKRKNFSKERIILTGDAAAFADPLTGEGISYALLSGKLAADSIVEGNFEPKRVSYIYNKKVKEKILNELKYAWFLSRMIYTHSKLRTIIFNAFGSTLIDVMVDIMTGKRTYSELMTKPSSYFKLIKLLVFKKRYEVDDKTKRGSSNQADFAKSIP